MWQVVITISEVYIFPTTTHNKQLSANVIIRFVLTFEYVNYANNLIKAYLN